MFGLSRNALALLALLLLPILTITSAADIMDHIGRAFDINSEAIDAFDCDIYVITNPETTSDGLERQLQIVNNYELLRWWHAQLYVLFENMAEGYVWNREPLSLFVNMRAKVPCISGRMAHGDSIDDEWLAVWILREATKKFPELVVSVRDSDGEFLLAEAALHIPHWITPENSQNRVFIHNGRLHILPLSIKGQSSFSGAEQRLSVHDALCAVACQDISTFASFKAEKAAFSRLEVFPGAIMHNVHRARCKLPILAARLLSANPQLIAAATELLYTSDPRQMKACRQMQAFRPEPSTMVTVSFNRTQYAKLVSRNVNAPPIFEMPPEHSPDYKASMLGMKVACGFEILSQENSKHGVTRSQLHGEGPDDVALKVFLEDLKQIGYFDETQLAPEQIDRRQLHAMQYFSTSQRHARESGHSADLLVREAGQILERTVAKYSASDADSLDRPGAETPVADAVDDDDSWLTIHPEELDSLMRKAESVLNEATQDQDTQDVLDTSTSSSDHGSSMHNMVDESGRGLQGVLGNLEAFLATNSGIEGAVTIDELLDDEYDENSDEDIDIDADGVLGALMEAIGINDLSELDRAYQQNNKQTGSTDTKSDHKSTPEPEPLVDEMAQIMDAMDHELSATNIGKSFVRNERGDSTDDEDIDDEDGDIPDVNVDLNLVENIVQSFKAQEGLPGPAGTMLSQFGIHLPLSRNDGNSSDGA